MLTIGCCSYNFRGMDLEGCLRLSADMGFRDVNIGAFDDSHPVSPTEILERPEAVGRTIREACGTYGLTPHEFFICSVNIGGGDRVQPNDPDAGRRARMLDAFRKVCVCAYEAGLKNIMGVPGLEGLCNAPDEGLSISVESLSAMLEIAREHGVVFTIEPHTGSIAVTPDKVKNLLSKVPGLRLSLDYTHFIGTGWKVKDLIPLHDFAYHLHGKPANANAAKCLFYEGEDFFPPLIADLVARKWDGVMAVECMYPMDAKDRLSHPAFQTVLLAGHLEKCLMEAREGKTRI